MFTFPMLLDTRGASPDGLLTLGGQEAPFEVFFCLLKAIGQESKETGTGYSTVHEPGIRQVYHQFTVKPKLCFYVRGYHPNG